jgi:hypothetical protein
MAKGVQNWTQKRYEYDLRLSADDITELLAKMNVEEAVDIIIETFSQEPDIELLVLARIKSKNEK